MRCDICLLEEENVTIQKLEKEEFLVCEFCLEQVADLQTAIKFAELYEGFMKEEREKLIKKMQLN